MGRLTIFARAGLLAAMAVSPASAADLFKYNYQPSDQAAEVPVELGTGWYLRGDVAWTRDQGGQLSPDIAGGLTQNAWQVDLGVGYKWTNWFRTDLTFGFHKLRDFNRTGSKVTCPYGPTGMSTTNAAGATVEIGYLWDSLKETCSPVESASMRRQEMLLNGYFDLGTWYGVTPYVGAGVGVAKLTTSGSLQYYKTSDGTVYNADLSPIGTYPHMWLDSNGNLIVPQPAIAFAKQDWTRRISATSYNFAWALMGGIAIDLTSHAKLDVGYRYLNLGKFTSATSPLTGKSVTSTLSSQEVRVGFRYLVD